MKLQQWIFIFLELTAYLVYSEWGPWMRQSSSKCSATCGGGKQTVVYERECDYLSNTTTTCPAEVSTKNKTEVCNTDTNCPVDGGWSEWKLSNFEPCTSKCGSGTENLYYVRFCDAPKPKYRGKICKGLSEKSHSEVCQGSPNCPVDAAWNTWTKLMSEECNATCAQGKQTVYYSRRCDRPKRKNDGRTCEGSAHKSVSQPCDAKVSNCPVNGQWSAWELAKQEPCTLSCGEGSQLKHYKRNCDNPAPKFGGHKCGGQPTAVISELCNTQKCPIAGGWGSWAVEKKEPCSVSCGLGTHNVHYRRQCSNPAPQFGGQRCDGTTTRTLSKTCTAPLHCSIDGRWSEWKRESAEKCSVSCGPGTRYVTYLRKCNNPEPQFSGKTCTGPPTEKVREYCRGNSYCPAEAVWSSWFMESPGYCRSRCGVGYRIATYKRICSEITFRSGHKCNGSTTTTRSEECLFQPDCIENGVWGPWTLKTKTRYCSVTCGSGVKYDFYTRACNKTTSSPGDYCPGDAEKVISKLCNPKPCPVHASWSWWLVTFTSQCSVTCGQGIQSRTFERKCTSPTSNYDASICKGQNSKRIKSFCNTRKKCPVNGGWESWRLLFFSHCSRTCGEAGILTETFARDCNSPAPKHNGKSCEGIKKKHISLSCKSNHDCPIDGGWSEWEEMTKWCSATCEGGHYVHSLVRHCNNPSPQNNGEICPGKYRKVQHGNQCNTQPCPIDGAWGTWIRIFRDKSHEVFDRFCDRPAPKYSGKPCGKPHQKEHYFK